MSAYILLDRFVLNGQHIIRAQHSPSGECVDVMVASEDARIAGAHWGGSVIPVVRRDGQLWYYRDPAEADPMTDEEVEDMETRLRRAAARKIAPNATDEQIDAIYRRSMSQNQRIAAIRALAG
jgi:hypothetical protein